MAQTITLNFKIIGQSLERLDDNRIVEKAKNYVNTHFDFNELWDDTIKTILIEGSGLRYKVYLNENNECLIPNRVVRHDGFTLTVVGEDADKNITITTNDLFISILSNNVTDDTPSYVEVIESDTLDVTREGEKYNLEIPESYKNCYIVTSNDISDITLISGGTYSVTLSEEMASVITTFKQNLYIDWENEFPDILSTLQGIKLTNCYPSKKLQIDAELETYYIFSATDGYTDFNMSFYYVNDTWRVTFTMGNLATQEYVSMEVSMAVADKSKVVANPTLSGNEPDLEGAEIDGIKYKVGGGSKLYEHNIFLSYGNASTVLITIYNRNSTPLNESSLISFLTSRNFVHSEDTNYGMGYQATGRKSSSTYFVGIFTYENYLYSIGNNNSAEKIENPSITDIISEV